TGAGEASFFYVRPRNTIFLAYTTAIAESTKAAEIYFGANRSDEAGFCDCRPAYFGAWKTLLRLATHQALHGHPPELVTPLLYLEKKEIVEKAALLDVPLSLTQTCYNPPMGKIKHWGGCPSCLLRKQGFTEAGLQDPTL